MSGAVPPLPLYSFVTSIRTILPLLSLPNGWEDKKSFRTEWYKRILVFNPVLISSVIAFFWFVVVQKLASTSHRLFIKNLSFLYDPRITVNDPECLLPWRRACAQHSGAFLHCLERRRPPGVSVDRCNIFPGRELLLSVQTPKCEIRR
jgi:hypothetical protein